MIGELLPLLAKQADKYAIIRSMTHGIISRETASYMVQTGRPAGVGRSAFLCWGRRLIVQRLRGRIHRVDTAHIDFGPSPQGPSRRPVFSSKYKPFATGGDPAKTPFVRGGCGPRASAQRQRDRRGCSNLNTLGQVMRAISGWRHRTRRKQAYDLILGGTGRGSFTVAQEKAELQGGLLGPNTFGQSCLWPGVWLSEGSPTSPSTVERWDTHKQHFQAMRGQLPQMDRGMATLLQDLSDRGLLDSTIVWWGGEFGRTPKIQWEPPWSGGRGHYGKVFSTVVAGGGFRGAAWSGPRMTRARR